MHIINAFEVHIQPSLPNKPTNSEPVYNGHDITV